MKLNISFGLDVGDLIDQKDYSNYKYSFGLAVYQIDINISGVIQSPWILNCWVNLPDSWTPPPDTTTTGTDLTTTINDDSVTTSLNSDSEITSLFGIPFDIVYFVIGMLPVIIPSKYKNKKN